jgi:hypothetical protein
VLYVVAAVLVLFLAGPEHLSQDLAQRTNRLYLGHREQFWDQGPTAWDALPLHPLLRRCLPERQEG